VQSIAFITILILTGYYQRHPRPALQTGTRNLLVEIGWENGGAGSIIGKKIKVIQPYG
jgi:hypothetical protein